MACNAFDVKRTTAECNRNGTMLVQLVDISQSVQAFIDLFIILPRVWTGAVRR